VSMKHLVIGLVLSSLALLAAGIDGKWTAEIAGRSGKGAETKVMTTLDLKSSGEALTGTVTAEARRARSVEVTDGKVTGSQFSFKTKQTSKKGEQVMIWEGTVDGETLKGTRAREGAKRKVEFTAKRAN
jgi:hypothetical protein